MESKCPVCGHEGVAIRYHLDVGNEWFCNNVDCSFSCNLEDLPRIAAAMELARAKVKRSRERRNTLCFGSYDETDEQLHQAETRVLGVFGGE